MNPQTRARVRKIVTALKRYNPERVILFGSAARGDADAHSDIDIAVIKETSERFLDRLERVYELIRPTYALDALVYTPKEFAEMQAERRSFVEQIIQDGIVLYDRSRGTLPLRLPSRPKKGGFRMQEAEQEGRRWLEQAEYEYRAAKHNTKTKFFAVACFYAQQAAEKALKAFLHLKGERYVTGHSISELCDRCGKWDKTFLHFKARVEKLDRFYTLTRYPNALPGGVPARTYKLDDAQTALRLAEKVLAAVRRHFSAKSPGGQE